jgi:hypothetical protein
MCVVPEKMFFKYFSKEFLMSDSQSNPKTASNEAPKTPAPGTPTPAPQQNQGDKPASKPSEQQK